MSAPDAELKAFLAETGIAGPREDSDWIPLAGGISSDIWRVEIGERRWCVKRALPRLKVTAEWVAPVGRNAAEWEYLQVVDQIAPDQVPKPIAHDPKRGLFAMSWLDAEAYVLWKSRLLSGQVDPAEAKAVGDLLGRIHAATSRDPSLPVRFATDQNFHALRIEPYLMATARSHLDLRNQIESLAKRTCLTRRVLVHGDVSPKNILISRGNPVLLDAECAWFGDPAFDLAFCLNHLAIKRRIVSRAFDSLGQSFDALAEAYFGQVNWESRSDLEARVASLLPVLALARVDGKSPLEYLNDAQRLSLRQAARQAVQEPPATLAAAKIMLA